MYGFTHLDNSASIFCQCAPTCSGCNGSFFQQAFLLNTSKEVCGSQLRGTWHRKYQVDGSRRLYALVSSFE